MLLWPRALPRPLRFHDLRHTTATLLLRAGIDPHRVQRIMRHRDLRTTLGTYGHLDVEDLRSAVAALPSDVGGSAPRAREARSEPASDRELVTRLLPGLADAGKSKGRSSGFPLERPALQMEREKGFESVVSRCVTGTYAAPWSASESSTRPLDASVHVHTETVGGDTGNGDDDLPVVTPELFLEAGLIVAERASHALAEAWLVEEFLRQAVRQVTAVRGIRSASGNHG